MAVKSKTGLARFEFKPGKPKKSRQGNGRFSKPRHNKKKVSRARKMMDRRTVENWQKVKKALEKAGKTDSMFYRRAVAIVAGKPDPLK